MPGSLIGGQGAQHTLLGPLLRWRWLEGTPRIRGFCCVEPAGIATARSFPPASGDQGAHHTLIGPWNVDPVRPGIGVEIDPPFLRERQCLSGLFWTGGGDEGRGHDRAGAPRVLRARAVDQGDLPGAPRLAQHGAEDPEERRDGVRLRAERAAAAEDRAVGKRSSTGCCR